MKGMQPIIQTVQLTLLLQVGALACEVVVILVGTCSGVEGVEVAEA
jgi:hypothetical protein